MNDEIPTIEQMNLQNRTIATILQNSKNFIFDFDGVLADSEYFQFDIWQELIAEYKFTTENFHISAIAGIDDRIAIENLAPGLEEALYKQLVLEKQKRCRERLDEIRPVAGMQQFLANVAMKKNRFICSNSPAKEIGLFIGKNYPDIAFRHIIGKGDFEKEKPDPAPFLKLLQLCRINPAESVVFEDSIVGVQAAIAAGLPVIYLNRYQTELAGVLTCYAVSDLFSAYGA